MGFGWKCELVNRKHNLSLSITDSASFTQLPLAAHLLKRGRKGERREGVRYWHGMWALHARTAAAAHLPRYYLPIQAVGQRKEREGGR